MLLVPRKMSGAESRKAVRRAGSGEAASRRSRMRQVSSEARAGGDGGVKIVVENDASEELDDGGLNEESERRVGEWEVAVRKLAERDAGCIFEDVAEIPEHGEVAVLPEDEGGGGEEEKRSGEEIGKSGGGGLMANGHETERKFNSKFNSTASGV